MNKFLLALSFIGITFGTANAESPYVGKYSFDLVKEASFSSVVAKERTIMSRDSFMESLDLLSNGVSIPASQESDGTIYIQACMPHACNMEYTIWAINGNNVYSSLIQDGTINIYGNPPVEISDRLKDEH